MRNIESYKKKRKTWVAGRKNMTISKILSRVEITTSCWNWKGPKCKKGYGRISFHGHHYDAYRFFFLLFRGKVPKGLQLDHLCRNHACVNPDHLEPVTQRENLMRGKGACAENARKKECIRGHDISKIKPNKRGERVCLICKRIRNARRL